MSTSARRDKLAKPSRWWARAVGLWALLLGAPAIASEMPVRDDRQMLEVRVAAVRAALQSQALLEKEEPGVVAQWFNWPNWANWNNWNNWANWGNWGNWFNR